MTDQPHPDVQALRVDVVRLTHRVEELEATVLHLQGVAPAPSSGTRSRTRRAALRARAMAGADLSVRPAATASGAAPRAHNSPGPAPRSDRLGQGRRPAVRRPDTRLGRRHRNRPRSGAVVRDGGQPRLGHAADAGRYRRARLARHARGRARARPAQVARRRHPGRRGSRHRRPLREPVGVNVALSLLRRGRGNGARGSDRRSGRRGGDPDPPGAAGRLRHLRRDARASPREPRHHRTGRAVRSGDDGGDPAALSPPALALARGGRMADRGRRGGCAAVRLGGPHRPAPPLRCRRRRRPPDRVHALPRRALACGPRPCQPARMGDRVERVHALGRRRLPVRRRAAGARALARGARAGWGHGDLGAARRRSRGAAPPPPRPDRHPGRIRAHCGRGRDGPACGRPGARVRVGGRVGAARRRGRADLAPEPHAPRPDHRRGRRLPRAGHDQDAPDRESRATGISPTWAPDRRAAPSRSP